MKNGVIVPQFFYAFVHRSSSIDVPLPNSRVLTIKVYEGLRAPMNKTRHPWSIWTLAI